jgi:hypothetical protein
MRLTYLASLLAMTLFSMPNLYANKPLSSYFQCKEFAPTGRFKPSRRCRPRAANSVSIKRQKTNSTWKTWRIYAASF